MKKALLIILLLGLVITATGIILAADNLDHLIDYFSTDKDYTYHEVDGLDEVNEIVVEAESSDIVLHMYEEEGYKVDFYESEYDTKTVSIIDGKLYIKQDRKFRFRFFNFSLNHHMISKINIYIPDTFYGEASIKTVSGDVSIQDYAFTSLKVQATSGDISIVDIESVTIDINSTSGKVSLEDVLTTSSIVINSNSGDVSITNCEFPSLKVELISGNININDVIVNNLNLSTVSGDVNVTLEAIMDDYKLDVSSVSGSIYYKGTKISGGLFDPSGSKSLKIRSTSGTIRLN